MAEVVVKNIRKVYEGQVTAVDNLSFTVQDKEFMVLVGPSGCGKSTLLRMIAGLEEISGGDLLIGEKRCNDVAPKDRDIAMVFQNYALYPHMTVAENLGFGLKLRRVPKEEIRKRTNEAAEMLGLTPYLLRKPRQLSGGQRQRVALGRAIVRKPKVFLFDEPLSNLDAKLRVQMRVEISRLSAELQTTMIYVTHDQTEAMTMGHRIACMRDGKLQQLGTPMELYNKPANRFVAGFIGMPPMNFLACDVRGSGTDAAIALPMAGEGAVFPAGSAAQRPGFAAGKAVLGIRPEHLRLAESGAPGFSASVEVIEPLGAETMAYCRAGQEKVVVRLHPDTSLERGQEVRLMVDPDRVHFFPAG